MDRDSATDIVYPSTIPFLIVHLACFAAIWTGVELLVWSPTEDGKGFYYPDTDNWKAVDFDSDLDKADVKLLRTGGVVINGGLYRQSDAPFGGYKRSGLGREYGAGWQHEYTHEKAIVFPIGV